MVLIAQLIILLGFSFQPWPESIHRAQSKGSIAGTVARFGTGEPVPRARVTAVGDGGQEGGAFADELGRFVIHDLDFGTYRIEVTANGYVRQTYGQRFPRGPGTALVLVAGQSSQDIQVALVPAGEVGGRIRDHEESPVAGLEVQLLRVTYNALGWRSLRSVAEPSVTDERGQYRILSVMPERYYLIAGSPLGQLFPGRADGVNNLNYVVENNERYALSYYPGVVDVADAVMIDVPSGQDLPALDFTVHPRKTYTVRGRSPSLQVGDESHHRSIPLMSGPPGSSRFTASFLDPMSFVPAYRVRTDPTP